MFGFGGGTLTNSRSICKTQFFFEFLAQLQEYKKLQETRIYAVANMSCPRSLCLAYNQDSEVDYAVSHPAYLCFFALFKMKASSDNFQSTLCNFSHLQNNAPSFRFQQCVFWVSLD